MIQIFFAATLLMGIVGTAYMPQNPTYQMINGMLSILGVVWLVFFLLNLGALLRNRKIQKVKSTLNNPPDFVIKKSIFKYDLNNHLHGLAFDDGTSKIALISNAEANIIPFDAIMRCDLTVDSETVTHTERGSQMVGVAVGALLLGGVGAVIGGLSGGKRSKKKITELALKVIINDLRKPMFVIPLFSEKYARVPTKEEIREVDEWHSLLQIIISRGQK